MISDIIVKDIIESINNYTAKKDLDTYIPSETVFKNIIQTAFFAGLKKEEGESVRFSLQIASKYIFDEMVNGGKVHKFDSGLTLDISSIVKIAPAHDEINTAIVVCVDEDGFVVKIAGLLPLQAEKSISISAVLENNVYKKKSSNFLITISSVDVGSLVLSLGENAIGVLRDGLYSLIAPTCFNNLSLGYHLEKIVKTHALYNKYSDAYLKIYFSLIKRLLSESSLRGHGSTVVFVNSRYLKSHCRYINSRYKFFDSINIEPLIKSILKKDDLDVASAIVDKLVFLAQLSTVDGALIISDKFKFIGFGATLSAPSWTGKTITGPDGFGQNSGEVFGASRLGTRHNSAISFAGKCKESLVFVVSHDGPIRAFFSKDNDRVICWPNCVL